MVAKPLLVVVDALRVEERHGQTEQFREVVAEDIDVDARTHVEAHPASYQTHGERAEEDEELREHDAHDKPHVAHADAIVHHRLCEEWRNERDEQPEEHGEGRL